jgi:hypothetical protein
LHHKHRPRNLVRDHALSDDKLESSFPKWSSPSSGLLPCPLGLQTEKPRPADRSGAFLRGLVSTRTGLSPGDADRRTGMRNEWIKREPRSFLTGRMVRRFRDIVSLMDMLALLQKLNHRQLVVVHKRAELSRIWLLDEFQFLEPAQEHVSGSVCRFLTVRSFKPVQNLIPLVHAWSGFLLAGKSDRVAEITDDTSISELQFGRKVEFDRCHVRRNQPHTGRFPTIAQCCTNRPFASSALIRWGQDVMSAFSKASCSARTRPCSFYISRRWLVFRFRRRLSPIIGSNRRGRRWQHDPARNTNRSSIAEHRLRSKDNQRHGRRV